jgi:hypothetical protein
LDKVHITIQEVVVSPGYSPSRSVARTLQLREVTYSCLQREVMKLAIGMVAMTNSYTARDWIEKERFQDLTCAGTRHRWHPEVSRTPSQQDDGFKYVGMQTFRIDDGKLSAWGNRKDGEDGLVTWRSSVYKAACITRPEWLRYHVGSGTATDNVRTIEESIPDDAILAEW